MIASVCLKCDEVYRTREDGKAEIVLSHGYCEDCLPDVRAEVDRQIAEMDRSESRAA